MYYKLFFLLTIVTAIFLLGSDTTGREGFEDLASEKFRSLSGPAVYDHSYAGMYDGIFVRKQRISHEFNKLFQNTDLSKQTWVLDVGCGTGHLVGRLHKDDIPCVGMDRSEAMLERAKENYPGAKFVLGDATQPSHNYFGKFDVITCMYFTYYEMKNKEQFLRNCLNWLKPGGKLYLHLADSGKIDPILPVGNVLINIDPQDYSEKKITTTRAVFENKQYKGDFQNRGGDNYALVETVVDRRSGHVKRLERELLMPPVKHSVAKAQAMGFTSEGGTEMLDCGYGGQYIYVFRKTNSV